VVREASASAIADAVLDGADQADRVPGRAQRGVDEVRGGRLAVGPGDADERQRRARIALGGRREHASASRASGTCTQALPGARAPRRRSRGALLAGGLDERFPSVARPRIGDERDAGARAARVVGHRRDGAGIRRRCSDAPGSRATSSPSVTATPRSAGGFAASTSTQAAPPSTSCPAAASARARARALQLDDQPAPGRDERRLARGAAAQVRHQAGLAASAAAAAAWRRCRGDRRRHTATKAAVLDHAQRARGIVGRDRQVAQRLLGDAREDGAATSPPWLAAPRGVSSETRITSSGREAGTKPTNEATWSIIE
jgi:hypothetical protein